MRGRTTQCREKRDAPDAEARARNGTGRNRADNWRTSDSAGAEITASAPQERRDRDRDRTKSWRDRDRDQEQMDDRGSGRTNDRRWGRDRDQRQEREPEWFDEPVVEQKEAHTQQDFQKWMEQMKKAKSGASSAANPAAETTAETSKRPVLPSAPVETGPDKFFMAFGGKSTEASTPGEGPDSATAAKAKAAGKSSRFTSFFSQPQTADPRARTEPPAPQQPPSAPPNGSGGLGALFGAASQGAAPGAPVEERQAFQQLLAKLQKQTMSATPPGPTPFAPPPQQQVQADNKKSAVGSPEPFQQYGGGRRDGPTGRPPSQQAREIHAASPAGAVCTSRPAPAGPGQPAPTSLQWRLKSPRARRGAQ